MIWLSFYLRNPFAKRQWHSSFGEAEFCLTDNKVFEFMVMPHSHLVDFTFDLTHPFGGQDHAGPSIEFGVLGYSLHFGIRDLRHWYYEEDRWFEPGEEAKLYNIPVAETKSP